jgi:DNA-directed RNA polymerase specialized sigma subunit
MKQQQPTTTDKEKKMYFTQVHEDAILEYASVLDINRKSELYRLYIQPAFNEMVDKIVYTYKFTSLPNIEDLKDECKIWLTTILDKYDTSKGSKAFSYFSVITKNWFIHKVKKNNNRREVYLEDIQDTADEENLIYEENYVLTRQNEEFWENLSEEMDSWNFKKMKSNEEKVYKAIQILFKDSDNIEIFNKKAIYLYIREITGLNTKQVVSNLKKFKLKYEDFKKSWEDGDI